MLRLRIRMKTQNEDKEDSMGAAGCRSPIRSWVLSIFVALNPAKSLRRLLPSLSFQMWKAAEGRARAPTSCTTAHDDAGLQQGPPAKPTSSPHPHPIRLYS